ncbi:hypothetical protein TPHA_0F00430 [Tetrapisispora phaffii CBS 4417]|uniref:Uncharacterized protein n=1 Tax=Tetrapisispora phaffii (strain ATCC 24235 / CBS 4417 / NBRC 1672 / NRRL Y-8282 / UCD 70-5) TaxID=1071381 RepID=G8BUU8_TETPH|nr:hypothetical protein TPHA_0F00430 [Tetrapisispora phaffii CBS 4417]CCE63530.1 hypothetical protein TPHA_0F00430 [Tetrapisispora phaffii CBS 4417]
MDSMDSPLQSPAQLKVTWEVTNSESLDIDNTSVCKTVELNIYPSNIRENKKKTIVAEVLFLSVSAFVALYINTYLNDLEPLHKPLKDLTPDENPLLSFKYILASSFFVMNRYLFGFSMMFILAYYVIVRFILKLPKAFHDSLMFLFSLSFVNYFISASTAVFISVHAITKTTMSEPQF